MRPRSLGCLIQISGSQCYVIVKISSECAALCPAEQVGQRRWILGAEISLLSAEIFFSCLICLYCILNDEMSLLHIVRHCPCTPCPASKKLPFMN